MLGSIDLPLFQESRVCRFGYEICLHHHERWDGGGYPDGLKGDQIPPYVQAVSLADAYDALRVAPVSYTHLDVYKRQIKNLLPQCLFFRIK